MSKTDLMKHRKDDHPDIIKKCKYYCKGNCAIEDKICWFSHEENNTQQLNDFKCRFCEKTFQEKLDFMMHRKTNHSQIVSKCRDYQLGRCNFSEYECWYKHDEISFTYETENEANSSVFQKAPEDNHPPDMMKKVIDMMEMIMMKVKNLENSQNIHQ